MDADNSTTRVRVLREHFSKLCVASLRVSKSLEADTVLREVVDSSRMLIGAGCSLIATRSEAGTLEDFVSSGLSPEEHQRFLDLFRGSDLWAYLCQLSKPLRLRDLAAHLRSLGFPDYQALARSFMSVPICHRGVQIGNLYLADKEGGQEFTDEDEGVLMLLAFHAGAAIANARTHHDVQRARASLEALIDTSPVGVVVFDANSGRVVSANQESRRMSRKLCLPGGRVGAWRANP